MPSMRIAAVLGLLLLVGLGIVLWSTRQSEATPPPAYEESRAPAERTPAAAERGERRLDASPAAPEPAVGAAAAPPSRDGDAPDAAHPPAHVGTHLRLLPIDATTLEPIPAWTARLAHAGGRVEAWSRQGPCAVDWPAGLRGRLLVEAEGYEPAVDDGFTVPTATTAPVEVRVTLTRAATAAGIALLVHDAALQPIANVRVEAFVVPAADPDAWRGSRPLWSRRNASTDGRYTLPTLAPGHYAVRVLAVAADGTLLPFLPFERRFLLTGSNGFVEDVVLEAGCIPEFEIVDATGALLVPGAPPIGLSLRLPGGPEVPRQWLVRQQGELFRGLDVLPGVGAASPEMPVAAGSYVVVVRRPDRPAHEEPVLLRAGERQAVRIVVP